MKKATQQKNVAPRRKNTKATSTRAESVSKMRTEDDPDSDMPEDDDMDALWFTAPLEENDRSRVQRQMRARRELERRLDEKHLKELVDDWQYDDRP